MTVDDEEHEKTERERMLELGGAGVYNVDLWRRSLLEDNGWKYDMIPEIMDGKNVCDFVDPDIDKKLRELEKEEALLLQESKLSDTEQVLNKFGETKVLLDEIHSRMRQRRLENRLNKSRNHVPTPRKANKKGAEVEEHLNKRGVDGTNLREKVRGRSASRKRDASLLGKRKRALSAGEPGGTERALSLARGRSKSRMLGLPSEEVAQQVEKKRRKKMKQFEKTGMKGEADKWIPDMKPKHLYSGKRGIGKRDRR